jgi:dihydroorotate dehydrogenase (NAD+) catalytic subunit
MIAGASAVQVGSAHFTDPRVGLKIIDGIRDYLNAQGIPDVTSLIGSLKAGQDTRKNER